MLPFRMTCRQYFKRKKGISYVKKLSIFKNEQFMAYIQIFIGCLLGAMAYPLFLSPNYISPGGLTGVAAAVSAAREGMKVLLLEQSGFLGGALGNCLVNPFMPYSTRLEVNGEKKLTPLSAGIFTVTVPVAKPSVSFSSS